MGNIHQHRFYEHLFRGTVLAVLGKIYHRQSSPERTDNLNTDHHTDAFHNSKQLNMQQKEKYSISTAAINRIIIGIILLILLVEVGFFKTYIRHFPLFKDYIVDGSYTMHFNWIMHVHGIIMMGWVLMLLVQPILILKGKIKWHRRVGALSYVLAPLVVLALFEQWAKILISIASINICSGEL